MKRTITTCMAAIVVCTLQSFTLNKHTIVWKLDKSHSSLVFGVEHLSITETKGEFLDYTVTVKADKPDFTDAQVELSAAVNSIYTKDDTRDKHLKSADFFDAEQYPHLTFTGKRFVKIKGNQYKLIGDLTMHGVTKAIMLDAVFGGIIKDPWGGTRAGVVVKGDIDRYDFGLRYNPVMEAGGLSIGRMVHIHCSIELIKGS